MNYEIKKMEKPDMMHATYTWRVLAFIIDFVIFVLIYLLIKPFLRHSVIIQSDFLFALIGFIVLNFFFLAYLSIMESSPLHASLGKYFLGVKVMNSEGKPCSFRTAIIRNAIKLFTCSWLITIVFSFDTIRAQLEIAILFSISTNPVWYDFIAIMDGEKHQYRLVHDDVAHTQVVMV